MRGRRVAALMAAGFVALAAGGCGGDGELAPEVPGPPADIVVPESADAPTSASGENDASADDTGDATTDDTGASGDTGATTTTPEEPAPATGDTGATTTPDTSGGTTAPDTTADGPTNDTPPPEGSNAEQFEDFCAQNPGAC